MQGHIRKRSKGSWEYIIDIGPHPAQRCLSCRRRFWVERPPRPSVPAAAAAWQRPRSVAARPGPALPRAKKPR
jgi:hypothetical protein